MPGPCTGGDWAWLGLDAVPNGPDEADDLVVLGGQFGFGSYRIGKCVNVCGETSMADDYSSGSSGWELRGASKVVHGLFVQLLVTDTEQRKRDKPRGIGIPRTRTETDRV